MCVLLSCALNMYSSAEATVLKRNGEERRPKGTDICHNNTDLASGGPGGASRLAARGIV